MGFGLSSSKLVGYSKGLAIISLASFFILAVLTISELWLRKWKNNPTSSTLLEHIMSEKYESEALVIWTAKQMSSVIKDNGNICL